mgnify:CR=1 FL=1
MMVVRCAECAVRFRQSFDFSFRLASLGFGTKTTTISRASSSNLNSGWMTSVEHH